MHAVPMKKVPDRSAAIASALRTVATEQAGVAALADALQNGLSKSFARAIELVSAIRGRVIVTGVGKSGHIGAKIAATLASTGTPAFFVHPVEAESWRPRHDRQGRRHHRHVMVGRDAPSSRASSPIRAASRIPLIAITSGETSALARESDVVLLLPRVPEACPHGLAPTTSTLLQLVVGDALAIALLEARGFTPDHFRTFHPGGQLGANLMQVRDVMHQGDRVPVAPVGSALREAIVTLSKKRFGCVCIVGEDGRLAGIITDGDLARNLDRNLGALTVDDIMTRTPKTIDPDTLTGEAIAILDENRISALVVVEGGKPVGIVHFHDLLRIGVA